MSVRIEVDLGERSYPIIIDGAKRPEVHRQIRAVRPDRVFAVFDAQVFALHGRALIDDLKKSGEPACSLTLPIDERAKNRSTVNEIHDWLLAEGVSRSDLILAVGGGVTTDLIGYAAATVLRGVSWGAIPTTLVGMIDAAIGGKTGINHPLAKNAIGVFWQPQFVYSYTPYLNTLDERQVYAGIGELIKYAGLAGESLIAMTSELVDVAGIGSGRKLEKAIAVAAAYKAALVSEDERDVGIRQFLNLGHTFAHGLEQSLGYGKLLHGEAVSVGLLAAVYLSEMTIAGARTNLAGYRQVVEENIARVPRRTIEVDRVLKAMEFDKKRAGRSIRLILLKRPGRPVIRSGIDSQRIRQALERAVQFYRENGGKRGADSHH
ncbi:hypothetical protein C3F09_01415 [candidate division GN15 bacterium]|uniref:3-dehydroquinate synthase n=1 Tax=candidate division GN15 bacterium TaxID=2072418 RepID=A0A855XC38_9BACT|nr:MAG: hypothetical protein C3F09_01415 [candidate division GN15 bacterium]